MRVLPMVLLVVCVTAFSFAESPAVQTTPVDDRVSQYEQRIARLERRPTETGPVPAFQATRGIWQIRGNEILSPLDPVAQLQLAGNPPKEYVLSMRVRRLAGHNTFAVQLPMAGRPVLVALDAHAGTVSGLEFLDGKYVHENAATFRGTLFAHDTDTSISLTIRKDRIVCTVDDVKVIDWQGDVQRLSVPENLAGADRGALHLLTLESQYAVSRITVVPIP